MEKELSLINQI